MFSQIISLSFINYFLRLSPDIHKLFSQIISLLLFILIYHAFSNNQFNYCLFYDNIYICGKKFKYTYLCLYFQIISTYVVLVPYIIILRMVNLYDKTFVSCSISYNIFIVSLRLCLLNGLFNILIWTFETVLRLNLYNLV